MSLCSVRHIKLLFSTTFLWIVYILCYLCLGSSFIITVESKTSSDLDILDQLLKNYDRRANPNGASSLDDPTTVYVQMYVRSFGSISPATMVSNGRPTAECNQQQRSIIPCAGKSGLKTSKDYEADLYLRQRWKDERLTHENFSKPLDFHDPRVVQMIWKPEVFFPNAKDAAFQYVTVPNVVVSIYPNGEIMYMLRLKLTFSCMMDLTKFPMDHQVCSIELASFAKTTRDLVLEWADSEQVKIYDQLKLPQFTIEKIEIAKCSDTFHIGQYSCLRADIGLRRSLGYHMVQSYLPTTLIVVVSWVSFWLEVDAIAARVTLGVTTLLTISSESTGIRGNLPPVSYVKALDVWIGVCTTFVFLALIEFTVVNYLSRRGRGAGRRAGYKHKKKPSNGTVVHVPLCSKPGEALQPTVITLAGHNGVKNGGNQMALAKKIDSFSRAIFPAFYLAFNLVYWLYYGSA